MVTFKSKCRQVGIGVSIEPRNEAKTESRHCRSNGILHLLTHKMGSVNKFLRGRRPNHNIQ